MSNVFLRFLLLDVYLHQLNDGILIGTLWWANARLNKIVYCVISSRNDSQQLCNTPQCRTAKDCETLDYFTQNASNYLQPHTHFLFLPGYHEHTKKVIVNGTIDIKFSGLVMDSRRPVIINCTVENVGFLFHNFTGIVFENLAITNCGQVFIPQYFENRDKKSTRSAALSFDIGTNLTLNSINMTNPIRVKDLIYIN